MTFVPPIAWHILYIVKEKKLKMFKTFFVLKVIKHLSNFFKNSFFDLFLKICSENFLAFLLQKPNMELLCDNLEEKKVENMTLKFFSNSAFSRFFQDFHYIS